MKFKIKNKVEFIKTNIMQKGCPLLFGQALFYSFLRDSAGLVVAARYD